MKHKMKHKMILALLAFCFLRASSCARLERPYPPPSVREILASLSARSQRIQTLRAETRMSQKSSAGKVKATVRLMAQRGGKLRCDVVSPFDTPLATLVSNGQEFSLVDAKKNRHFFGPALPCNLSRLMQVALAPDDILTILGGSTPLIDHVRATLAWDERSGEEVLTLSSKTAIQVIRLDGRRHSWDLRLSEVKNTQGEVLLRIEGADFKVVAGLRAPSALRVSQPKNKTELDVTFKSEELNIELPSEAFELLSANGLPSQRVDCQTTIMID
jgi:outer membrane lipoprotein-sorting protein